MKISIGADHRGYRLKAAIIKYFTTYTWSDVGTDSEERTDYPLFAQKVCNDVRTGKVQLGILLCGSGVGITIAANRFKGIYAGLCWNADVARMAREDDGINILVLPADFMTDQQAFSIITAWLNASFKEGIYQKRLEMIDSESFSR